MNWKRTYLTLLVFICIGGAHAGPFVYDGKFVASEYDQVFSVEYEYDSRIISGGTLALATVGSKQYLYISHPIGFKDFSYGSDAGEKYRVGWDNQGIHANYDLGKAVDSEFFGLSLTTGGHTVSDSSDDDTYALKFDLKRPSAQSKINGALVNAGASITQSGVHSDLNVSFISTLDYDAKQISGSLDGSLGAFDFDHSPETLTPGEIAGCADETSSDQSCYQLRDTAENKIGGNLIDWIFDFGIEIELVRSDLNLFFGDLTNIDLSMFGYQNNGKPISLNELHASDPKTILPGHHFQTNCLSGLPGPNHEPCSATVVDPPSVPEPSTIVLLSLGLLALGRRRKTV